MKRWALVFSAVTLILLSCRLATISGKSEEGDNFVSGKIYSEQKSEMKDEKLKDLRSSTEKKSEIVDPQVDGPEPQKPITQYDTMELDKQVIIEAVKLGQDPKTYRKPVHTEADGTQIYRMIGSHVIVNPKGEEVFLPDEL